MDDQGAKSNHVNNADQNSDSDANTPTLETVSGFSNSSSPLPPQPFEALFEIKFLDTVEKDGDVVKYTISSTKKCDDSTFIIKRQYEDFEWLEHCLLTANPLPGLIVPPLPPKPAITSEMAEAKSKKQLGNDTKTLIGDQFNRDCFQLEKYIQLLLSHPLFGKDEILERFLIEKEPPPRAKIKRGLLSRITESFEGRKNTHHDCEEFFQTERNWVSKYSVQIKETHQVFASVVSSQQRLSGVIGHLATAFMLSRGTTDLPSKFETKLCSLFSEALEDTRHSLQLQSHRDENTLGAYLDLYTSYIESEKEMLYQRTGLLIDYESANRALDKAKPAKKQSAEDAKLAAEKAFEDCSDVARQEIKKFHRQRVAMFQESLEKFAEAQLKNARDITALLAMSLTKIKQYEITF